eukprot:gene11915-12059_t
MDGPDALLALADVAVSGNDKSADSYVGKGPPDVVQSAAEEEEDLLLCLADNLAVAHQQGNEAWVALFGEAHKEHYSEVKYNNVDCLLLTPALGAPATAGPLAEGSVIAFYQPRFTSKAPGGSSSSSGGLAVSQSSQVELLASSAGWGFCRGKTKYNVVVQFLLPSRTPHAQNQQHAAAFSKLLDQYEQKDQLAQQLEGITKLLVTAFQCRTCDALTEKRRASCSGHDVVAVRVVKRWWLCEACGWKLTTLREVLPSKRCPKCRDPGKLFQPTSAYSAPKSLPLLTAQAGAGQPLASKDAMLPRGEEHAKFLNSMQS